MEITAQMVKELREITNLGMMECRKALVETQGDRENAIKWLRERGLVKAGTKADRKANQGLIAANIAADGLTGSLIEVNCETDFVAKNENFIAFVNGLSARSNQYADGEMTAATKDELASKIMEIGENLVLSKNIRYQVAGEGFVSCYIHLGGKVGVLVEIGCEKAATRGNAKAQEIGRDVCMHIAASSPLALERAGIPAEMVESEKAIYAKQVEGKPAAVVEKILAGKLDKFYQQNVLTEQAFVKDQDKTIGGVLEETGKLLGDKLTVRRYVRLQIGA